MVDQRLAVDVGGTFTDLVLLDGEAGLRIEKEPSAIGESLDLRHCVTRSLTMPR